MSAQYPSLAVFGDSIAFGYDNPSPATQNFAAILRTQLQALDAGNAAHFANYAQNGKRAVDWYNYFGSHPKPSFHGLAVVELGNNEWVHGNGPDYITLTYPEMFSRIFSAGLPATLICTTEWRDPTALDAHGNTVDAYNAAITAACEASGVANVLTVDITSLYDDPANHAGNADSYHPGPAGQTAIATAIYSALTA